MAFRHVKLTQAQVRKLWADPSITSSNCRDKTGFAYSTLQGRAKLLGLGPRRHPTPALDRVDPDHLRQLWAEGWSIQIIAARCGTYRDAVGMLAKRLGLPPRPFNGKRVRGEAHVAPRPALDMVLIADLYRVGVSLDEIGRATDSTHTLIGYHVRRMKLPPRVPLRGGPRLTLEEGRAALASEALARALAADAKIVKARWIEEGLAVKHREARGFARREAA